MKIDLSNLPEYMLKNFRPIPAKIRNDEERPYFIFSGGRGSGKTTFLADFLVSETFAFQEAVFLVGQKYQADIKDASYKAIWKSIKKLGLEDFFAENKSDRRITNTITGTYFIFKGLDKASSKKGMEDVRYAWFEEGDQIAAEDFRMLSLTMRHATKFISFNPTDPFAHVIVRYKNNISETLWQDGYSYLCRGTEFYYMHSTYLENEHAPKNIKIDMRELKKHNPEAYKVDGLGEVAKLEDNAFHNFEIREFDIYQMFTEGELLTGLDFGWSHPTVWVKVGFLDSQHPTVYVCDEISGSQMQPEEIAKKVDNKSFKNVCHCDSADPSKIEYLNNNTSHEFRRVNKSLMKRDEKIKFLTAAKLVVHPRCKRLCKELYLFKRKKKKDVVLDEFEKINDDAIDAVVYALEPHFEILAESVENEESFAL